MADYGLNSGLATGLASGIALGGKAVNEAFNTNIALGKLGLEGERLALEKSNIESQNALRAQQIEQAKLANQVAARNEAMQNRIISTYDHKNVLDALPNVTNLLKKLAGDAVQPDPVNKGHYLIPMWAYNSAKQLMTTNNEIAQQAAHALYSDAILNLGKLKSIYDTEMEKYNKQLEKVPLDRRSSVAKPDKLVNVEKQIKEWDDKKQTALGILYGNEAILKKRVEAEVDMNKQIALKKELEEIKHKHRMEEKIIGKGTTEETAKKAEAAERAKLNVRQENMIYPFIDSNGNMHYLTVKDAQDMNNKNPKLRLRPAAKATQQNKKGLVIGEDSGE